MISILEDKYEEIRFKNKILEILKESNANWLIEFARKALHNFNEESRFNLVKSLVQFNDLSLQEQFFSVLDNYNEDSEFKSKIAQVKRKITEKKAREELLISKANQELLNYSYKHITVKIGIIGDRGVGKTSLIKYFMSNSFVPEQKIILSHKSSEFFVKNIENHCKLVMYSLELERFLFLSPAYLRSFYGALLVFDLTRLETLKNLKEIILKSRSQYGNIWDFPLILIGTKLDAAHFIPKSDKAVEELKQKVNFCDYIKTSFFGIFIKSCIDKI